MLLFAFVNLNFIFRYDLAADAIRREMGIHQQNESYQAMGRLAVALVLVQLARGDVVAAEKAYKEWGMSVFRLFYMLIYKNKSFFLLSVNIINFVSFYLLHFPIVFCILLIEYIFLALIYLSRLSTCLTYLSTCLKHFVLFEKQFTLLLLYIYQIQIRKLLRRPRGTNSRSVTASLRRRRRRGR